MAWNAPCSNLRQFGIPQGGGGAPGIGGSGHRWIGASESQIHANAQIAEVYPNLGRLGMRWRKYFGILVGREGGGVPEIAEIAKIG
jgi:hypothetical protein